MHQAVHLHVPVFDARAGLPEFALRGLRTTHVHECGGTCEEHDTSAALSSPRCPGPLCVGWPALCPAGAGRHPETETSSPSPAGAPASHAGSDGAAPPGPPAASAETSPSPPPRPAACQHRTEH